MGHDQAWIDRVEATLLNVLSDALGMPSASPDAATFHAQFKTIKQRQGGAFTADRLRLSSEELEVFEATWRTLLAAPGDDRPARIARLRVLSWMESIADRLGAGDHDHGPAGEDDQVLALKRVRAVELILRSLILETHQGQDALLHYLEDRLPKPVLEKWRAGAQKGNILTGTTFSELASLFVAKEEFPRYEALFDGDAHLRLLRTKRETVRAYLDDIRRVRNIVAHHKELSPVQTELLDHYYTDLVEPLQHAADQGRITTDPKRYLDIGKEELTGYFRAIGQDIHEVRDELGALRSEVREGFRDLKEHASRQEDRLEDIRKTIKVDWLSRKMVMAYAVIAVLLAGTFFLVRHYGNRPFTATIQVHGPKGPTDLMLRNKGKVLLAAADHQAEAPINENGQAIFTNLPSALLEEPVRFSIDALGEAYTPIDPEGAHSLVRDGHLALPIHLKGSDRLTGIIRDLETGAPIEGAKVRILDLVASSGVDGRFELPIPLEKQQTFHDVEITATGYKYDKHVQVPMQGDEGMEIMLEPSK